MIPDGRHGTSASPDATVLDTGIARIQDQNASTASLSAR
jgi:hypothetical protein